MQRLNIYLTPGYIVIGVQRAADRQVSGKTLQGVLDTMAETDRAAVMSFCSAVVEYLEDGRVESVDAWDCQMGGK